MSKIVKTTIVGDTYLKLLLGFRIATIGGRFGGGKTLLAVALAYWLKGSGKVDKIVCNFPVEHTSDDNGLLYRSAIILDEAWGYITSRQSVSDYSAYLRKIDSYLILPSVFDIHYRLSFFESVRLYNLQNFGIPAWYYSWKLKNKSVRDKGSFWLTNPQVMYGTYDTSYIPLDDAGISLRLKETIQDAQRNNAKSIHSSRSGSISGNSYPDDLEALADDFFRSAEEAGYEIQEATNSLRKAKRR